MPVEQTILTKEGHVKKTLIRSKAIREKCLECCVWQTKEVRLCPSKDCALWHYRMGYTVWKTPGNTRFYRRSDLIDTYI